MNTPQQPAPKPPDEGYDYRCCRCDHQWRSRRVGDPTPRACAKCRSAYWDRVPKEKSASKATPKPKRKKRQKSKTMKTVRTARKEKMAVVYDKELSKSALELLRSNINSTYDAGSDIESVLPPPPHMRRTYRQPESEPSPETLIGRKDREHEHEHNRSERGGQSE